MRRCRLGPAGAGKSAVAAKIVHAAKLIGRKVELTRADGGLALFRTGTNPPELLTVMEADGFNPLNVRAASALSPSANTMTRTVLPRPLGSDTAPRTSWSVSGESMWPSSWPSCTTSPLSTWMSAR